MRADAVSYGFFSECPFLGTAELIVRKIEIVPHMAREEVLSKRGKRHKFRRLVAKPHSSPRLRYTGRGEVQSQFLFAFNERSHQLLVATIGYLVVLSRAIKFTGKHIGFGHGESRT